MIVSAIPFTGNKRKLWKQIEPLLPEGDVFLDLFTGGGTMSLNATKKYNQVYGTELMYQVAELHSSLKNDRRFIDKLIKVNEHYPSTEGGYYSLREDYNIEPSPVKLLNLVLRSNTNYMRFNSSGGFNAPYGRRNHFNLERLQNHIVACEGVNIAEGSYETLLDMCSVFEGQQLVVYCDPLYATTIAPYCEGGKWTSGNDERLLEKLLTLHKEGAKIVISNVFENRGVVNQLLINWCELHKDKFVVHHLNRNYSNCSFRKSNQKTDEVLIVSR